MLEKNNSIAALLDHNNQLEHHNMLILVHNYKEELMGWLKQMDLQMH